MPESQGPYRRLTVAENLACFADLYELLDSGQRSASQPTVPEEPSDPLPASARVATRVHRPAAACQACRQHAIPAGALSSGTG